MRTEKILFQFYLERKWFIANMWKTEGMQSRVPFTMIEGKPFFWKDEDILETTDRKASSL